MEIDTLAALQTWPSSGILASWICAIWFAAPGILPSRLQTSCHMHTSPSFQNPSLCPHWASIITTAHRNAIHRLLKLGGRRGFTPWLPLLCIHFPQAFKIESFVLTGLAQLGFRYHKLEHARVAAIIMTPLSPPPEWAWPLSGVDHLQGMYTMGNFQAFPRKLGSKSSLLPMGLY
jgi:hypothetical protein